MFKPGDKQDPTDDQGQAPDPLAGVDIDDGEADTDEDIDGGAAEGGDNDTKDPDPDKGPDNSDDDSTVNQEAVDKKIAKATWEKYEEKRKREAAEAELARLKGEQNQGEIEIPPMPDRYDPDFDEKVEARDQAILQKAEANAATKISTESQVAQANEQIQSDLNRMYTDAEKLGIKESDMRAAEDTVAKFVQTPDLAKYLIGREDSAQVISHLAEDIVELDKISKMPPIEAATYIATEIAPKATVKGKPTPGAPDPLDIPGGKGQPEPQSEFLKGVEFE